MKPILEFAAKLTSYTHTHTRTLLLKGGRRMGSPKEAQNETSLGICSQTHFSTRNLCFHIALLRFHTKCHLGI
jgi:hypothetical protein